ncbi:HD domain-containing phosphohydrolase [Deinococcus sp.]|uniref:HD-GYP domain-containing protein n=1 Tax=Deinococcus sp. TaxID=47478 RepID=UPI003CC616F2
MTASSDLPASEVPLSERAVLLRAEAVRALDAQPQRAVPAVQDYRAFADLHVLTAAGAHSRLLLAQALLQADEPRTALEAVVAAAQLYRAQQDALGEAQAWSLAGKIHRGLGAFEAAEEALQHAVALVQRGSTPAEQQAHASALNQLAGVQFHRGGSAEALLSLELALGVYTAQANASGQASCLTNIATIQDALGQYHAAIQTIGRAYALYKTQLPEPRSEAFILNTLARLHASSQDIKLATEVGRSALLAAQASQDAVLTATTRLNLGTFHLQAGQYESAALHLQAALEESRALEYRAGELSTLDSLGMLHQQTGRMADAREAFTEALALALDLEDTQGELDSRLHLATVDLLLGDLEAAEQQVRRGLELSVNAHSPKEEAEAHRILAELFARQSDYRRAFEHSQEHLRVRGQLFDVERDRQTRNLSIQFEVERVRHNADVSRLQTETEQRARERAELVVVERTAELARAQHEVVTRLALAAEYRDDTTGAHTKRVGQAAARIARALGWLPERAEILGVAARLHDVGKIGIPDAVLLKAGKLSAEEFEQMKTHTLIGARILSGGRSELLRLAEEIALTHHERWDGSGYPNGLRAEQIPLTGRIVALADVYDALTQERPYKRAWTPQEALKELQSQAGTHFDPLIVQTALRVLAVPASAPPQPHPSAPGDQPEPGQDDAPALSDGCREVDAASCEE